MARGESSGWLPDDVISDLSSGIRIDKYKGYGEENDFNDEAEAMFDDIYQLETVVAPGRNFEIERPLLDAKKDSWDVVLVGKNGERFSFASMLPEGFILRPGDAYMAIGLTKVVYFKPHDLDYRESLLSIAHEIGHAQTLFKKEYKIDKPKVSDVARGTQESAINMVKVLYTEMQNPTREVLSPRELYKKYDGVIPDWFLEKIHNFKSKSERDAWAYGLRLLRDLDEQGFNVFDGFEDSLDIMKFITFCLTTYEAQHERTHYFTGNDDSYKPLFAKGYKRIRPEED